MKPHSNVAKLILASLAILTSCGFTPEAKSNQDLLKETVLANANAGTIQLSPDSPQLKQIRVDPVQEQTIATDDIVASATVEADPGRSSHVLLPSAGRIVEIPVRVGDFVARGQPVLYLESSDANAALATYVKASAALAQARTTQSKAEGAFERAMALFMDHSIAKKDLLAAEAKLGQAEARLARAEIVSIEAKVRLDLLGLHANEPRNRIVLRSPISGTVVETNASVQEFRNDPNKPVLKVADLALLRIAFVVPEGEARLINPGDPLQVDLATFPNRPLRAIVAQMGDVVEPATRMVKVYAELANPQGDLRPKMSGRVRLTGKVRVMPTVPATALVRAGDRTYVYRQTAPGRFEQTPVEIAGRTEGNVCISKGLQPADRVVVEGILLLWPK